MADPEQSKEGTEEPNNPAAAGDVQSSGQINPAGAGVSKPSEPTLPAVAPAPATPPPPTAPTTPPVPTVATVPTVPKQRFWANRGLLVVEAWRRLPQHTSKEPFWMNLTLFVLLVGSVAVWFLRHMEHWFAGVLIGGGGLATAWLALQWMFGALKSAVEEQMKTLPKAVLSHRWSLPVLITLLIASIGLNVFTSSFCVEYVSDDPAVKKCTVETFNAATSQRFVEPPMTVTSEDKVAAKRFFFRFRPTVLKFNLTEPRGHEQKVENFGLATAILLRAPADFPEKQFHILRLVFGPRLWNNLAESDEAATASYDLELSIGGKTMQIHDVRRQTIHVGALSEDINYVLEHENPTDRKNDFVEHLSALGLPTEQQQGWIDAWQTKRRVFATDEHLPGEPVTIMLFRRGTETPMVGKETKMTPSTIQTIALEMP